MRGATSSHVWLRDTSGQLGAGMRSAGIASSLPHSAFPGETPDEIYFGTGGQVQEDLASQRKAARTARLETNRAVACKSCEQIPAAG